MSVRSLVLDIETRPGEGYIWGLFDQTVGLSQLIEAGSIMSWSAKWVGSDEIYFSSTYHHGRESMIEAMWELLDEADEVVTYNGNRFDLKHINAEFIMLDLGPPSPYKKIDLMQVVKANAKFMSNKLAFISDVLGIGSKIETGGFELWLDCMKGKKKAWDLLRVYNEEDVLLTERLYDKLRPWINSGVNRSAIDDGHVCPNCGGTHLHSRGYTRNLQLAYRRWHCNNCGTWSRSVVADKKADRKNRLVLAR